MRLELEAIVSADEAARARLERIAAEGSALLETARGSARREQEARAEEERRSLEEEVGRIVDEGRQEAARRAERRRRYLDDRRAAAEAGLERAIETYLRIVQLGPDRAQAP